ncbi:MAG: hypothetical protein EAX86_06620 [Candidatus Heimdallarchaeota archaeon]|nr:hypothetical protein [Candidatus Heimdallarchaeota archaeon]
MKIIRLNHSRSLVIPLIPILLVLITNLSGCLQNPSNFNPEYAIFYDPLDKTQEQIRVINMNSSSNTFYHQDQIQILVGLKDTRGNLGVNYTLIVEVVYLIGYYRDVKNLTEKLGIQLITNKSGIAQSIFTYNQYTWPRGVNTQGYFEVSSPEIANTTAHSTTRLFTFKYTEINRNSTMEGGIDVILNFESRNLIEEAQSADNETNDFMDMIYQGVFVGSEVIINKSTIETYSSLTGAPERIFIYRAWTYYFDTYNLSCVQIVSLGIEKLRIRFFDIDIDGYDDYNWISTSPQLPENIPNGWLIIQYMSSSYRTNTLNGYGFVWNQVAIINGELQLQWLISRRYAWES